MQPGGTPGYPGPLLGGGVATAIGGQDVSGGQHTPPSLIPYGTLAVWIGGIHWLAFGFRDKRLNEFHLFISRICQAILSQQSRGAEGCRITF